MKTTILILMFFTLISCEETTKTVIPNDADLDKITWKQYDKWCGSKNIIGDKNFEKVQGKEITWVGYVVKRKKDSYAKKLKNFLEEVLIIKMEKSENPLSDVTANLTSDLTLRLRKELADNLKKNKYGKGDKILFRGTIAFFGDYQNHIIEVSNIKLKK